MRYLKNEVIRLALTYLMLIMVMSFGFSVIFYNTSVRELSRAPTSISISDITGAPDKQVTFQDYLTHREGESKQALFIDIVAVNILAFIVGGFISYLLASYTLRPIEESLEAQSLFVSDASHELRTPLTALRLANEVAIRDKNLSLKSAKTVIHDNVADIKRLQGLTDSMLGLLRDDDTKVFYEVHLSQIVGESLETVVALAQAKNISVEDMTSDIKLRGNGQRLVQLLTILIDNAIKYSEDGSNIYIMSDERTRYFSLTVKDEGIGMDKETANKIFTRFYQAEESRTNAGFGLGLSIAKKIVDSHKGKIFVDSQVGVGTSFKVVLPIRR